MDMGSIPYNVEASFLVEKVARNATHNNVDKFINYKPIYVGHFLPVYKLKESKCCYRICVLDNFYTNHIDGSRCLVSGVE